MPAPRRSIPSRPDEPIVTFRKRGACTWTLKKCNSFRGFRFVRSRIFGRRPNQALRGARVFCPRRCLIQVHVTSLSRSWGWSSVIPDRGSYRYGGHPSSQPSPRCSARSRRNFIKENSGGISVNNLRLCVAGSRLRQSYLKAMTRAALRSASSLNPQRIQLN